jgi:hypothetical protein
MRYKVEGEFKVKQHAADDEVYYTILLECGEVFLVDSFRFCEITDLGDLYLISHSQKEYHVMSKDLKRISSHLRGTPDEAISYGLRKASDFPQPFLVNVIESQLQCEPCVNLDEFNRNYDGNCLLIKHIDGNTYLHT